MARHDIINKLEMAADAHGVTWLVTTVQKRYEDRVLSGAIKRLSNGYGKEKDDSLITSKILHPLMVQTYIHFARQFDAVELTSLMKKVGCGNEKAVLYHGERCELPQSFFLDCLVTAMKGDISKAYAARFVELFTCLGYLRRTNCISGPANSLAVAATDDLFQDMDEAYFEKRRYREELMSEHEEQILEQMKDIVPNLGDSDNDMHPKRETKTQSQLEG